MSTPMTTTKTTTLYLVRHADVHNPRDIVYGRLPRFKLSALGRQQADQTARFLADRPLAAVYTSPQLRARQTAAAIAAHHPAAPLRTSALLAEVRTAWQGAANATLGKYFNFYEPQSDPADEGIADIFRRMRRTIELLRRRYPGGQVVCVSHGDPIVIARTGYAGLPLVFANLRRADYPERGSVTGFTFDGRGELPLIWYVDPGRCAP